MLVFLLTSFSSQAQKDSVWQNLTKPVTSQIKIAESTITKYNTKTDSIIQTVQDIPLKYVKQVDDKIAKYSKRITGKTEKTLAKLSKWENKIRAMLEKVSPETAQKLFANEELTFSGMLKKYNEGKAAVGNYTSQYNEYRDKLTTNIKYLSSKKNELDAKFVKPLAEATQKADKLEDDIANTEAVEKFIKQRKKQLIDEAVKYIGKSKYLKKINKESYYYVETLRNYKEIFSDPVKIEKTAFSLLKKIPAFNEFADKISRASLLFGNSNSGGSVGNNPGSSSYASLGYQSNAMISQTLQQRNLSGPNIQQLTQGNASSLNSPLQQLKNQFPDLNSTEDLPNFKPNEMKSKTFKQRLQFGTNLQFGKSTNIIPNTTDIGLQMAYKLNAKSSVGIGTGYKIGLGNSLNKLKLCFEGIGFRGFIDWKLKSSFYINGGFEYNYNNSFKNLRELPSFANSSISLWKPAALIGISKKYSLGKMKGNVMLAYDFLAKNKIPKTQNIVFRFGYSF